MQAAVLQGKKQMDVLDWKRPVPGPFEVVVKVKSCGICGTDQHIYHGHPGSAEVHPPIVLGHELAGEVVETGSDVSGLQKRDGVSIDPNRFSLKELPEAMAEYPSLGVSKGILNH